MSGKRGPDGRFVKSVGGVPSSALTSAASVVPRTQLDMMPRYPEAWQERAWRLWRLLGVLHFPTSFKAKQVGRLGWNVEVDGKLLEEDQAIEALEAVTGGIGIAEAARRIALNLEVAGEVWYARRSDEWNVYASTTPKRQELLKAADIVVRGWQPDPEEPSRPTSSIQAALGTAEQIRLMCALSRGQDRNRLAQRGILLVPKEGTFPEGDDFQANLEEAMTAPIADEYAPSSVVPLKVDFPAEYIEKWRHLVLESPYDDKLMERIEKAIVQLAREIDMPPEVLLGNLDSNHWNAWLSNEDNYRGHVEPLGVMTGQVFANAMMEAADIGVLIKVTPDPAELLSHPPSFEDSITALKMGVVGFEYVRRILGADEDDAPTDDEIELILKMQGLAPVEVEEPEVDAEPPPMLPPGDEDPEAIAAAVDDSDDELDELARRLSDIDFRLLSVLEGLTSMSVAQVREKVVGKVGGQEAAVLDEMGRLGKAWNREVSQARKVLRGLGIDARGQEWDEAQALSVQLLEQGVGAYIIETLEKSPSQMPALPTPLLRQVLATAGGSGTATVAAIARNPAPTFADPQGFAIGVLPLKALKAQDVQIVQWRFRYGPMTRAEPFEPHKAADGQFMTSDGETSQGWSPGDHRGCECGMDPVLRRVASPKAVKEKIA